MSKHYRRSQTNMKQLITTSSLLLPPVREKRWALLNSGNCVQYRSNSTPEGARERVTSVVYFHRSLRRKHFFLRYLYYISFGNEWVTFSTVPMEFRKTKCESHSWVYVPVGIYFLFRISRHFYNANAKEGTGVIHTSVRETGHSQRGKLLFTIAIQ